MYLYHMLYISIVIFVSPQGEICGVTTKGLDSNNRYTKMIS